jgi:hypothetical protein
MSSLDDFSPEPVANASPVETFAPIEEPKPLDRRYDDIT